MNKSSRKIIGKFIDTSIITHSLTKSLTLGINGSIQHSSSLTHIKAETQLGLSTLGNISRPALAMEFPVALDNLGPKVLRI